MFEEIGIYHDRKQLLFDSHMLFANREAAANEIVSINWKALSLALNSLAISR